MDQILKCFIIDDEKKARENISLLLNTYCPQVEIIGEAGDKKTILEGLSNLNPDVVFLDVQLGSITIFDILDELEEINFKIIFVSAFNQYAVDGYKYNALGYLLKPIDPKLLVEVINKAIPLQEKDEDKEDPIASFNQLYAKIHEVPKISITDSKGTHVIKIPSVLYCISNGNYTTFIRKNEKEIVISKNLKYIESKLQPFGFFRIHRSYLINLDHVNTLVKEQGGYVVMSNEKSLPIARDSKKELYRKLNVI
ncbi:two component transcriptional regulator, LytTR family [Aquimarina amphilecti]|uniref:Two component transcriptional regulator, LytTR family n=1 Tax=Aquimarina amphilecti TaxID=1038014 RepID=A0A1H7JJ90_AQUAM|nr:LytTR family DNA-binding domain-containing protein [Aquimarina amphilecti]SEK73535.1 two component transcriptional regulator, LytTR family [Aquimarina amphilecti]